MCVIGWLCVTSHQQRGHLATAPSFTSLAKDVKLGFDTVPTGNRTPGRRVAVHYTIAAPRELNTHTQTHTHTHTPTHIRTHTICD